jgi:hypothetical protein
MYAFSVPIMISPKCKVNAVSKTGKGVIVSCRRGVENPEAQRIHLLCISDANVLKWVSSM